MTKTCWLPPESHAGMFRNRVLPSTGMGCWLRPDFPSGFARVFDEHRPFREVRDVIPLAGIAKKPSRRKVQQHRLDTGKEISKARGDSRPRLFRRPSPVTKRRLHADKNVVDRSRWFGVG